MKKHWTTEAGITAPCHTARSPTGEEYFVPGCMARAADPEDGVCTCLSFEQAARELIAKLTAENARLQELNAGLRRDVRRLDLELKKKRT